MLLQISQVVANIHDMSVERAPALAAAIKENLKGVAVSIDIDAVTQATYLLALRQANLDFGHKKFILKENLTTYWELANIARANGVPDDKAIEYARSAWNRHEVYLNSPEMPGIRSLLEIFDKIDVPYFFISSRPVEFLETTQEWFKKTFQVKKEKIILGRPEGVPGGDFKATEIKKLKELGIPIGIHIEDALEEAVIVAKKAKVGVVIVPQPWNAQEKVDDPKIKQLGPYSDTAGAWQVLRFLASPEARAFLDNVAQY